MPLCSMNENQVGERHLVMIITNELFCNEYGYNRQGKKVIFSDIEEISVGVGHADAAHCYNDRKTGVTPDEIPLVQ